MSHYLNKMKGGDLMDEWFWVFIWCIVLIIWNIGRK